MSQAEVEPAPPPLPAARRWPGESFCAVMLISLAALYFLLKFTLVVTRAVKPIYMEANISLPLVTVQAMALVEGALRYGRLYLGVSPLIIATVYVMLASRPVLRRAFVAAMIAAVVIVAVALTLFLIFPLFTMTGPG